MSGAQGIYKLEKKVALAAARGLRSAPGPNAVKFSDHVKGLSSNKGEVDKGTTKGGKKSSV